MTLIFQSYRLQSPLWCVLNVTASLAGVLNSVPLVWCWTSSNSVFLLKGNRSEKFTPRYSANLIVSLESKMCGNVADILVRSSGKWQRRNLSPCYFLSLPSTFSSWRKFTFLPPPTLTSVQRPVPPGYFLRSWAPSLRALWRSIISPAPAFRPCSSLATYWGRCSSSKTSTRTSASLTGVLVKPSRRQQMNFPVCQSKWLGSWPPARFSCIQSYFQCVLWRRRTPRIRFSSPRLRTSKGLLWGSKGTKCPEEKT